MEKDGEKLNPPEAAMGEAMVKAAIKATVAAVNETILIDLLLFGRNLKLSEEGQKC